MKKTFYIFFIFLLISLSGFSQNKEAEAVKLYEQKSLDASEVLFQEIINEDPGHPNAIEYLGNIAFDKQQYRKAADYIKSLIDRFPNTARYHFKYAGAIGLISRDNKMKSLYLVDDIKKHFHIAADLDKNFVDARLGLVHLYLELPGMLGGSKEKALYYAKEIQELDVKAGMEAMRLITAAD